jgi:hypothetical protein
MPTAQDVADALGRGRDLDGGAQGLEIGRSVASRSTALWRSRRCSFRRVHPTSPEVGSDPITAGETVEALREHASERERQPLPKQRDHAHYLIRLATAYLMEGEPEQSIALAAHRRAP